MISRKALLPLVLSLACFGMVPASAEESHKNLCVGTGRAELGTGISFFPTITVNVAFSFTFQCATGGSVTGSGTLDTASCGRSLGSGTFAGPPAKSFDVETAGSMLIITQDGNVIGAGNATPIPDVSTIPFGNSCSSGTARVFALVGFVCTPGASGPACPDVPSSPAV